jgi:hypothetical protein
MADYQFWITDDKGARLASLNRVLWMNASREANAAGWFEIGLPVNTDRALLQEGHMLQLWRAPRGGRLGLWNVYYTDKLTDQTTPRGEFLVVEGPDKADTPNRRIVVGFAGQSESDKTDKADDMMKEVVREQFGAGADGIAPVPGAGTRVQTAFSVAPDIGAGPTITKQFAWANVSTPSAGGVLAGIARASEETGPRVYWTVDVLNLTSTSISFEFRTHINQPGRDLTSTVVFDQERGNLRNAALEIDYSRSINYVYAGGSGRGTKRNIQQVWDAVRFSASRWARREGFAEDTRLSADDAVRELGRAVLDAHRPRQRFSGTPIDTGGMRFGRDWDQGDRVQRRHRGFEQDSIAAATTIALQRGTGLELIANRLDDV